MINGVDIGQVVAGAVARAGYEAWLVQPLLQKMGLHLLTMKNLTPERVEALAKEMLPGVMEPVVEEAFAQMTTSERIH